MKYFIYIIKKNQTNQTQTYTHTLANLHIKMTAKATTAEDIQALMRAVNREFLSNKTNPTKYLKLIDATMDLPEEDPMKGMLLGKLNYNVANVFVNRGEYSIALDHFLIAFNTVISCDDDVRLKAYVLGNIAEHFDEFKKVADADDVAIFTNAGVEFTAEAFIEKDIDFLESLKTDDMSPEDLANIDASIDLARNIL